VISDEQVSALGSDMTCFTWHPAHPKLENGVPEQLSFQLMLLCFQSLTRGSRCLDAQESARAWQEARDYISSIKAQMLKH
jgi:hypothetical protein